MGMGADDEDERGGGADDGASRGPAMRRGIEEKNGYFLNPGRRKLLLNVLPDALWDQDIQLTVKLARKQIHGCDMAGLSFVF
jgi:hypothetical protein